MSKRDVVVLGAARSAIGTFGGSLADIEPAELAGTVMKEAVKRSGVDPKAINYVTVGNCIPTESRYPYVARVASIQAGLPMDSVAMAVNRLCSSGLQGIVTTAQNILLGDCDYGVGGGVEVMSRGACDVAGLGCGGRGQHPHVGVGQQVEQFGRRGDPVGAGLGRRVAADAGDVGAERARAGGDALADGPEAEDHPARPGDLAERPARPVVGGLGGAAGRAVLQHVEDAPHDVVGHADGLAVAGGEAGALLDDLAEDRVVEAGGAALHPLQVGRLQHRRHERAARAREEGVGVGPGGLGPGVVDRDGLAAGADLAAHQLAVLVLAFPLEDRVLGGSGG